MNTQAARGVFLVVFGIAIGKAIAPLYSTLPAETVSWAVLAVWVVTSLGVMEVVLSPEAMGVYEKIERRLSTKEAGDS